MYSYSNLDTNLSHWALTVETLSKIALLESCNCIKGNIFFFFSNLFLCSLSLNGEKIYSGILLCCLATAERFIA